MSTFHTYRDTRALPVRILESSPAARPTGDSDKRIITSIMRNLRPQYRAAPTRSQWEVACMVNWPNAFIYRGGCHVAVHFGGADSPRDLLFTGTGPDWS